MKAMAILCSPPHVPMILVHWVLRGLCVSRFPFLESTNEKPRVRSSATQYRTYSDSQMTCLLLDRSFRWQHLDEGIVLESPKAIPFHSSLDSHSLFNSSSCHLSMRRRRGKATFLPSSRPDRCQRMDRIVQILIPELMKQFLQFLFSKKTFLLLDSFLGTLLRFAILWPAIVLVRFFYEGSREQ